MTGARANLGAVELKDTGIVVSRLILGCAPFGGLFAPVTEEATASALAAAFDAGISTFDTAPHYGAGLSEERLGAFLAQRVREQFVVSTKVGRILVDTDEEVDGEGFFGAPRRIRIRDYTAAGIRRSLEESLVRLGLDRVDIVLIHDPEDHAETALSESVDTLTDLRRTGVIGAVGVGMNQVALLERFVAETDIDCIMIAGRYSLLDSSAAERLLPLCAERGIAVFVAGVYNSGILVDPRPGATFDYAPAPDAMLLRAQAIRAVCERHGVALPTAALHYVLAHPAVTAVVVGARSAREVRENAGYFSAPVPSELFEELASAGLVAPVGGC